MMVTTSAGVFQTMQVYSSVSESSTWRPGYWDYLVDTHAIWVLAGGSSVLLGALSGVARALLHQ
jgi:hypothetical protein